MTPVVCLEGPSAVGKTTLCNFLSDVYGAYTVPEVNALFSRPAKSRDWYLEKQVERWRLAQEKPRQHPFSVLDGDVFQPLWYNWSFDFRGLESLDALSNFYRAQIEARAVGFPDLYIILQADEKTLMDRREKDGTRQRRNFEKHLSFIEPQKRYFRAFEAFSPSSVCFLGGQGNVQNVFGALSQASNHRYSVDLFDALVRWLRNYPARGDGEHG